jgi:hypothetical protein
MTTERPYRTAFEPDEAIAELRRCAGTEFDPEVVRVLIEVGGAATRPALHGLAPAVYAAGQYRRTRRRLRRSRP